jgi:hypothetical protein
MSRPIGLLNDLAGPAGGVDAADPGVSDWVQEKEKGSAATLLCLPAFDAQSTLLQCSVVIGVITLLALIGRSSLNFGPHCCGPFLCAEHVRQLGGVSPLPSLMMAKG